MPPKQAGQRWIKIDAHVPVISCVCKALAGVTQTGDMEGDGYEVCTVFVGVTKGCEVGMKGIKGEARLDVLGAELC